MHRLELKDFFSGATSDRKTMFDPYTVLRFMTYARIIDSGSKLHTWECLENYYEKPSFDYHQILRSTDVLNDNYDAFLHWTFAKSNYVLKRDSSVLYYDCTNFYFECEKEDDIVVDEVTGEIMSGLRKYGVSKGHRPNPIVEMGLFMDRNGIPISMCIHSLHIQHCKSREFPSHGVLGLSSVKDGSISLNCSHGKGEPNNAPPLQFL